MDNINNSCSWEFKLQKMSICFLQIRSRNKDIDNFLFRLLSRATAPRSRNLPIIIKRSKKPLCLTIPTQITQWNTFTSVWNISELQLHEQSTKSRTRLILLSLNLYSICSGDSKLQIEYISYFTNFDPIAAKLTTLIRSWWEMPRDSPPSKWTNSVPHSITSIA